ncbi:hypothetical protein HYW46_03435 [Candidatus Daviesbacteria bacterium]|nr:hypothetical protein [Candidatus Daviesbacteria bacterium]
MNPNNPNQNDPNNQSGDGDQPMAQPADDQTPADTGTTTPSMGDTAASTAETTPMGGMDQGMGTMTGDTTGQPAAPAQDTGMAEAPAMGDQTAPVAENTSGGDNSGQPQ